MPISELRLIKNALEHLSKSEIRTVPPKTRGIYVLYNRRGKASADSHNYDVVYVGMARGQNAGCRGRLNSHLKHKSGLWTHFSVCEVWDNVREEEVEELEGLFRHIYQYDSKANLLNSQKSYRKLRRLTKRTAIEWKR